MKRAEAVLLEVIPLAMLAMCLAYGFYLIGAGTSPTLFLAGHVVLFLAAICFALLCTATTIVQQLIGHYGDFYRISLPILGYAVSLGTIGAGAAIVVADVNPSSFIAGFVIVGLGLISTCVTTVATASTKFLLAPRNSRSDAVGRLSDGFSPFVERVLIAIPIGCALAGVVIGVVLLSIGGDTQHFVAGHVVLGLSFICGALIALVASITRQISNSYGPAERRIWPWVVVFFGTLNLVWGVVLVLLADQPYWLAPGWVMIGLGLICFSILSKVALLALVWRRTFALANRIPLIPVGTALACLFLTAFLFEASIGDQNLAVPARVLVGLGAVCFTLFSIVSILESGTKTDADPVAGGAQTREHGARHAKTRDATTRA